MRDLEGLKASGRSVGLSEVDGFASNAIIRIIFEPKCGRRGRLSVKTEPRRWRAWRQTELMNPRQSCRGAQRRAPFHSWTPRKTDTAVRLPHLTIIFPGACSKIFACSYGQSSIPFNTGGAGNVVSGRRKKAFASRVPVGFVVSFVVLRKAASRRQYARASISPTDMLPAKRLV